MRKKVICISYVKNKNKICISITALHNKNENDLTKLSQTVKCKY